MKGLMIPEVPVVVNYQLSDIKNLLGDAVHSCNGALKSSILS